MAIIDAYNKSGIAAKIDSNAKTTGFTPNQQLGISEFDLSEKTLDKKDLNKALRLLVKFRNYFIFPVCKYSHPIQRALFINKNNEVEFENKRYLKIRTQDLSSFFYDAGQFYLAKKEIWKKKQKKNKGVIIPSWRCHDIDTIEDWVRAENFYKSHFRI